MKKLWYTVPNTTTSASIGNICSELDSVFKTVSYGTPSPALWDTDEKGFVKFDFLKSPFIYRNKSFNFTNVSRSK